MRLLVLVALLGSVTPLAAQCSDAGVCRLGSRPESFEDSGIGVEFRLGAAANKDIDYRTANLGLSWHNDIGLHLVADLSVVSVDGPAGTAEGLGDTLVRASYEVLERFGRWSLLAGARLPTGDDNINPGLPQAYQTGLGPADMQFGLGWELSGFNAFVGYSISGGANDLEGTELERGDDVVASLSWQWQHETFRPGLQIIALQRLEESTVVTSSGGRQSVEGSDGLQVNIRPFLAWRIAGSTDLIAAVAKPQLVRDSDVDGLTRDWSLDFGLASRF